MNSIKIAIVVVGILIVTLAANAQSPNWTLNTSEFQYTMTVVAFLSVDNELLTGKQDKVAAFVDGKVRGVASPIYVKSAGRHLAYMTVFANKEKETIQFKVYDSGRNKTVDVAATLSFKIDEQYGNVFQAVSLANPALGKEAVIKNFFFTGVDSVSTTITDATIDIVLEYDQDLNNLTPEFIISDGAKVFREREMQESGSTTYGFLAPVTYSVLSADESVLKNYQVIVRNRQVTDEGFASTNVITANNDGANDRWIVQDVFKYRDHHFKIIDANGRVLFESTGYNNDWNGYFKGTRLERGNYYFLITDPVTRAVTKGEILVLY